MKNESYGYEFTANTSKFKDKMKEMSNSIRTFSKRMELFGEGVKEEATRQANATLNGFKSTMKEMANGIRNFGKSTEKKTSISGDFVNTGYAKEIEYVKDQMDAINDQIQAINHGEMSGSVRELEVEYERLGRKLGILTDKQAEFNGELDDTEKKSKDINLGSMFDKSISKIKRFTYYLLGARSVFSLFMKYQSIYYQYNEQMQYQSELSQNAIALSLAPAFELLGNVIAYASIAFAKFIELLTGVNVLSKVSTKGIRDYNKSLKETQTLVSGIDEITNLTNPQNLGLASQYKALEDFQKKIAEVEKFFKKNKWIGDLAKGLKTVFEYLRDYIIPKVQEFIDGIGGAEGALKLLGGVAVMGALAKLIGYAGVGATAGSGLAGIAGLLTFIAGTFVITLVLNAEKVLGDLQEIRKNLAPYGETEFQTNTAPKTIENQIAELKKLNKGTQEYKNTLKSINEWWDAINGTIASGDKNYLASIDKYESLAKQLSNITGNNSYTNLLSASKNLGNYKNAQKNKTTEQLIFGGLLNTFSLGAYNKAEANKLDKLIEEYENYKKKIGYASGLDYVPYDNYPAILHKGESVVPAKYNPTIHSMGNEETNALLETLIIKVDDLANRPNQFNIDGEQLARVTYPLLQAESKNYSYNEGVSR